MKLILLFFSLLLSIPAADLAGTWNIAVPTRDGGEIAYQLLLRAEGNTYSGTIAADSGEAPLSDVKLSGAELTFKVDADSTLYEVTATVDGDTMKGTYTVDRQPGGKFTATREKPAATNR